MEILGVLLAFVGFALGIYEIINIQQLHCVITLVYKDTALKTVNKEAFRECVKSMLKQSKMFTDKELDAMFA